MPAGMALVAAEDSQLVGVDSHLVGVGSQLALVDRVEASGRGGGERGSRKRQTKMNKWM